MPGSIDEGKEETIAWIKQINPKTVMDVGAGLGTYARLFIANDIKVDKIDAIEVWEPYIHYFKIASIYNNVFKIDARDWDNWNYDLVILGDILEHMTKEQAIKLWKSISKKAKYAVISIPIVHYPQGHVHGNPYEEHVKDDWSVEEVLESFDNIVSHVAHESVGVFFAEFK